MMWTSILFACWVTTVTAAPKCLDVIVSEKDTRVSRRRYCEFISVTSCISICKQDILCQSINYGVKGNSRGECCLSDISRATATSSDFHFDESFVYYDMGKVNVINDKEPVEKDLGLSMMNTCARQPNPFCLNNATCQETCGPEKFICRCNLANYGVDCLSWKGVFSDFDLFFPRRSVEDYVSQVISPLEKLKGYTTLYHTLSIAFWVCPKNADKSVTLLSIADSSNKKTVFRVRLIDQQNSDKLKLLIEVGNSYLYKIESPIKIPAKIWANVEIRWSSYYQKIAVKTDSSQSHYNNVPQGQYISSNSLLLVGQELVEGSDVFDPNWSFQGSISRISISTHWSFGFVQEILESSANSLTWPMMWDFYGPKIGGNVMKILHSEVKKEWKAIHLTSMVDPTIHNDGIYNLMTSTGNDPLTISAQINSDCSKSPAYMSVTLTSLEGTPNKIRYKQIFKGQMLCYGVFGGRLRGSDVLNDSGIYQLDTTKDRIYSQVLMGETRDVNEFASPLSGCGTSHFWYKNVDKTRKAVVSRRCKSSSSKFTITTFAKCGIGSITIKDIYFMY